MQSKQFSLVSPSFENNAPLPLVHAHPGYGPGALNESPALIWKDAPRNTKSFALILNDPDAVTGNFIHWIIYNIPHTLHELPYNIPPEPNLHKTLHGAQQGRNDYGTIGYGGPQPPLGTGIHRYTFTLYALDTVLDLQPESTTAPELHKASTHHIIGQATLVGLFGAKDAGKK